MTAPTMSPETIEEVDYDAAVPCTMRWVMLEEPVCSNEAEWIITNKCCGMTKLICDPCYQRFILSPCPFPFSCRKCGHKWTPAYTGVIAARRV